MFNKHYINIVEKTSRITPKNPRNPLEPKLDERTIREIIENYRNQGSIIKIKEKFSENAKTALVRPIYKKDEIHETMKDAFYLVLKALFILKMFKFLSRLSGHVGKTVSKFRESQPG